MKTTNLSKLILDLVKEPHEKVFLEVGAHDDKLALELAPQFKKVFLITNI